MTLEKENSITKTGKTRLLLIMAIAGSFVAGSLTSGPFAFAQLSQCENTPPHGIGGGPVWGEVWAAICELEDRIDNIQSTPGPQGPPGQGATEICGDGIDNDNDGNIDEASAFPKAGVNLAGCDLSFSYLGAAYLSGADLSSADLSSVFLFAANFNGAILTGSYLSGAQINAVSFNGADLSGADLSFTTLNPSLPAPTFIDTNLTGANLSGADLTNADFTGADLTGATTTGCIGQSFCT